MTTETTSPVPHHVEEAVATIAALHAAHHREARALQKAVSRATSGIAQPATLILTSFAIASWVTLNLALPEFGRTALDPFPFPLLAAVVSTIALYLAAMILMTQRHDDEMATRREQITLELAILSEQKSSKIMRSWKNFAATIQTKAINATKWQRHWQSPPMRRSCSVRSERRKRRRTAVRRQIPFAAKSVNRAPQGREKSRHRGHAALFPRGQTNHHRAELDSRFHRDGADRVTHYRKPGVRSRAWRR
jgi:uncharacterized membrane protein